jgi:hypothetical protein
MSHHHLKCLLFRVTRGRCLLMPFIVKHQNSLGFYESWCRFFSVQYRAVFLCEFIYTRLEKKSTEKGFQKHFGTINLIRKIMLFPIQCLNDKSNHTCSESSSENFSTRLVNLFFFYVSKLPLSRKLHQPCD